MKPASYYLKPYTVSTWTDLVPTTTYETIIKSLTVSVNSGTAVVAIQITNAAGTSKAILVPGASWIPGKATQPTFPPSF